MNMRMLLSAICLMFLTANISLASSDEISLGPASVSLDLSTAGSYSIEIGDSIESEHDYDRNAPGFQYSIYPASVTYEGSSSKVQIEVHRISQSQSLDDQISGRRPISALVHCLEQSEMMPRRSEYETEPYAIAGYEGLLATVDTGGDNPMYIAAFSPDESNGSGSTICFIGSDFPWDTTKKIFESASAQILN
jgi:hypothetical protein